MVDPPTDSNTTPMGAAAPRKKIKQPVSKGDKALDKVVNFIPYEVLVFYGGVVGALNSAEPSARWRIPLAWACLGLGAILTPIYRLKQSPKWDLAAWYIAFMSMIAFGVWAYSLGGIFAFKQWYYPVISGVVVLAFSVISGLFPLPRRQVE